MSALGVNQIRDAALFRAGLPDGWRDRRMHVGTYGRLTVFAAGRLDLVVMKFFAHREVDLEHLQEMRPTPDERAFASAHFRRVAADFPADQSKLEMATTVAEGWEL